MPPIRNGDSIWNILPNDLTVAGQLPMNLYIRIAPSTKSRPYITIVKYLLLGWNTFLPTALSGFGGYFVEFYSFKSFMVFA